MSIACPVPPADIGALRALLIGVDCNTRHYAEAGYLALTGAQSFFPAALTTLLTIYVALLGYRLLFGVGGARLAEAPLMALKIGAVVALTLQWPLFQTLVFDLAYRAPLEIAAATLAPPAGSDAALGADPLGEAQVAYDALLADAAALGRQAGAVGASGNGTVLTHAADDLLGAARTLFMATAGALAVALVAVGVLTVIGPIFIALFLFRATRGLFVGWLRALLAAAFAPMIVWATTALMLEVLRSGLASLTAQRAAGTLDAGAVSAVVAAIDVFALAQAAVIALGAVVAIGFRPGSARRRAAAPQREAPRAAPPFAELSRIDRLAESLRHPQALRERMAGSADLAARMTVRQAFGAAPARDRPPPVERLGQDYRRAPVTLRRDPVRGGR